jgi:5-methylcytosine-specific restriction endonuclease McrA
MEFFTRAARRVNWKRRGHGRVTATQLRELWFNQKGLCALTGVPLTQRCCHLDHIIPISRGGGNTIDNVRWTNPIANLIKGAKLDAEVQCGADEELPF